MKQLLVPIEHIKFGPPCSRNGLMCDEHAKTAYSIVSASGGSGGNVEGQVMKELARKIKRRNVDDSFAAYTVEGRRNDLVSGDYTFSQALWYRQKDITVEAHETYVHHLQYNYMAEAGIAFADALPPGTCPGVLHQVRALTIGDIDVGYDTLKVAGASTGRYFRTFHRDLHAASHQIRNKRCVPRAGSLARARGLHMDKVIRIMVRATVIIKCAL